MQLSEKMNYCHSGFEGRRKIVFSGQSQLVTAGRQLNAPLELFQTVLRSQQHKS